jgi:hypothetical protein
MAPNPNRLTVRSPPMSIVPAAAAFLLMEPSLPEDRGSKSRWLTFTRSVMRWRGDPDEARTHA